MSKHQLQTDILELLKSLNEKLEDYEHYTTALVFSDGPNIEDVADYLVELYIDPNTGTITNLHQVIEAFIKKEEEIWVKENYTVCSRIYQ